MFSSHLQNIPKLKVNRKVVRTHTSLALHQVILQSGSAFCPWATEQPQKAKNGVRLLCEALDCNSLAELRGIDSRNLVKAAVKINGPTRHNFFLPTPDDSVFFPAVAAEDEAERAKLGCAAGMLPTLQGINEREGAFLTVPFLLGQKTLDVDDMLASVLLLHDKSEANEGGHPHMTQLANRLSLVGRSTTGSFVMP